MPITNQNKDSDNQEIYEVLDETPPDINEPQVPDPQDSQVAADALPDPENEEPKDEVVEQEEVVEEVVEQTPTETPDQKEARYKSQQTEAQIQAEKNRSLIDNLDKASQVADPTAEDLKAYVRVDGIDWDELTSFEQAMAKKTYISEKRSQALTEAVERTKQVDVWAKTVDDFIDSTDGKPEYVELSSHEADFRKFAMKESHRNTPIDILLGAFLHNLPPEKKRRGSLFETQGGGKKPEVKSGLSDADTVRQLRETNQKEYQRLVKAGKIKIEI